MRRDDIDTLRDREAGRAGRDQERGKSLGAGGFLARFEEHLVADADAEEGALGFGPGKDVVPHAGGGEAADAVAERADTGQDVSAVNHPACPTMVADGFAPFASISGEG